MSEKQKKVLIVDDDSPVTKALIRKLSEAAPPQPSCPRCAANEVCITHPDKWMKPSASAEPSEPLCSVDSRGNWTHHGSCSICIDPDPMSKGEGMYARSPAAEIAHNLMKPAFRRVYDAGRAALRASGKEES